MANINNIKELELFLKQTLADALIDVANDVVEDTKASIQSVVYSSYAPDVYERTYALKNSVEITKMPDTREQFLQAEVGHNVTKLSYTALSKGHTIYDQGNIPLMIMTGQIGAIYQKGLWRKAPQYNSEHTFAFKRDYITPVQEQVNQTLPTKLIKTIKGKGYKIK